MSSILNKPSKHLVLDLINRDNQISLNFNEVDLTNLVPINGSRNTQIDVVGKEGQRFEGQTVAVEYNRLDLGVITGAGPIIVEGDIWDTTGLLSLVNDKHNLSLATTEVKYADLAADHTIQFKVGNSFAYLPNTGPTFKHGFLSYVDELYDFTTITFPSIVNPT